MGLIAGFFNTANAQTPYYQYDSSAAVATAYPWVDISTTGTTVPAMTDDSVTNIPLGFTFNYGSNNNTSVTVSSNGILYFAGNYTTGANTSMTTTGFPAGTFAMFPFWDDLNPSLGGSIKYLTSGNAPNRKIVIEYYNVPSAYAPSNLNTFEVQIFENGSFVYRYQTTNGSGNSATVGIMPTPATSDIVQFSYNTASVPSGKTILWTRTGVDHYEIDFGASNTQVTCLPQNFTIRACGNSNSPCTNTSDQTTFITPVTIATSSGTFNGTASPKTESFTGSTTDKLSATTASTPTLSLIGNSGAPLKCYAGGSLLGTCQETFNDTGFIFNWGTNPTTSLGEAYLDAEKQSKVLKITAVKKSDSSNACVGFAPTVKPALKISYSDPSTGTQNVNMQVTNSTGLSLGTIYGVNANPGVSPTVTWDSSGSTYFLVSYMDVGKVNINISMTNPVATGTTVLISKPYFLMVYNTASEITCIDGTILASNTLSKFCPAGETFGIKIRAEGYNGNPLPNFGLDSATANMVVYGKLKPPNNVGFADGNLTNVNTGVTVPLASGLTIPRNRVCNGTDCYLTANLSWSEVGQIQLEPTVLGDNYMGAGPITGKIYLPFGRFYPSSLVPSSPSLINRVNSSCSTSSPFSYMNEPFRGLVTLTAVNKQGNVTTNYDGTTFSTMDPTKASTWGVTAANTNMLTSRMGFISGSGTWSSGVLNASLSLDFTRNSSPDGPYNSTSVGIAPTDSDGVGISLANMNLDSNLDGMNDSYSLGTSNFYFGQLKIKNALGSDLLPLPVALEAQYYNNYGFIPNSQDNCTSLNSNLFSTSGFTQNIASNEISFTYPSTFISGKQTLLMNKPSGGDGLYDGTFNVTYDLISDNKSYLLGKWSGSSYNQNPSGKLVLAKNPAKKGVLFIRENF